MGVLKRFSIRGLNLRSSNINRDPSYATDVQNVELNAKKELVKRFGLDLITASTGAVEISEYKRGNQLIRQKSGGLSKLVAGSYVDINRSTGSVIDLFNTAGSYAEYNGVLYWADPSGDNEIYKYDGYTYYRAGVPAPVVATVSGAGTFFYRIYLRFTDCQGNITSGDYVQLGSLIDGAVFTIQQMLEAFYYRYGTPSATATIDAGALTVPMNNHNYVAGDYIYMAKGSDGTRRDPLLIASSVPNTSITIDATTLAAGEVYPYISGSALESKRTEIVLAKSANATYGYEITDIYRDLNETAGAASITATVGFVTPAIFLEDEYDTTILKGLPPRARYIDFYNNIMVAVNNPIVSFTQTASSADEESSMYWSDTGVGSTVETFPPFNKDTVGKSNEGAITGIKALSDNVVIGKERQIYYLNGNLILGSYRIRSALTNGIGCIAYRSMYEIEGGSTFMSSKGIYLARNGQKPIELSDVIEPYFKDLLQLPTTKIINDILNEKLLIHISEATPIVIVYDYYYKEWFVHKGIDGSRGIAFLGDDLYNQSSANLYKRSTSYNDDGVAIEAFYRGSFEDLGEPTIVKKFKKLVLIVSDALTWTAKVKTYNDWNESTVVTNISREMVGPSVDDISLNMTQKKAMRIEIGNDILDEGMLLTGYEIEVENTQSRPKGES